MPDDRFSDDDSFWDVKHLMPKRKPLPAPSAAAENKVRSAQHDRSEDARRVSEDGNGVSKDSHRASTGASRPFAEENRSSDGTSGETLPAFSSDQPSKVYKPGVGRIREVRLYPWPNRYSFFTEFRKNAVNIYNMTAESAPFTPFFSFMPQYHQLTAAQLKYYLYWRESFRTGEYLQTDFSYLLLFAYEIINLPSLLPPQEGADALCRLWIAYRKSYPKLDKYLSEWLCDYCLVNAVRPAPELFAEIAKYGRASSSLKEFYISETESVLPGVASSNYSYKASKYYTEEHRALFDLHIPNAVKAFIRYMKETGDPRFAEGQQEEETVIARNSYDGAVCVYGEKKRMELVVSLYKPSPAAALISEATMLSENHLRAAFKVRARLSTPSLTAPMKTVIERYFAENLPLSRFVKKEEQPEYLSKYDADSHGFSLEEAQKIEKDSVAIAERLGAVYEREEEPFFLTEHTQFVDQRTALQRNDTAVSERSDGSPTDHSAKDGQTAALHILLTEGHDTFLAHAKALGVLPATLVDAVNDAALERYGDIAIEESDGRYTVIEEYKEEIKQWINS